MPTSGETEPMPLAEGPGGLRRQFGRIVESRPVRLIVFVLLIANATTLGLETSPGIVADFGALLQWINWIAVTVFVIEIAVRFVARGMAFFRDPWNPFDVIVVGLSLLPELGAFSGFRTLRILRILRLISFFAEMRSLIVAVVKAIPAIVSITLLLVILNYVTSVTMTHLYRDTLPELFGNVGMSMLTLFQLMTLDGWANEVIGPILDVDPNALYLLLPFLIITAFAFLNLVIAVLVDAFERMRDEVRDAELDEELEDLEDRDRQILHELGEIKRALADKSA